MRRSAEDTELAETHPLEACTTAERTADYCAIIMALVQGTLRLDEEN